MHTRFASFRNAPQTIGVLPLGRAPLSADLVHDPDFVSDARATPRASHASRLLGLLRATSVLALGEAFSDPSRGDSKGKSGRVLERLGQLNNRLRIENRCNDSAGGFESVLRAAEQRPRIRYDALILFVSVPALLCASDADALRSSSAGALAAASAMAKRCYLVAAIDNAAACAMSKVEELTFVNETSAGVILQLACTQAGACLLPLVADDEDASIPHGLLRSGNFSVDGFHPASDSPDMWTARLLQQPALAQLVFN
jgi:hypothetical protein